MSVYSVAQSRLPLLQPLQAPLSMGFPRQEYCSRDGTGVPCIAEGFFSTEPPRKRLCVCRHIKKSEKIQVPFTIGMTLINGPKRRNVCCRVIQRFHLSEKQSNKKVKVKLLSRVRLLATPWTVAHQAPPSMRFSSQEYWSGLPLPSPGDLHNPGIEPGSPALQADALPSGPRPHHNSIHTYSSCVDKGKDKEGLILGCKH